MLMSKDAIRKLNLSYDTLYNLKSHCHLNGVFESRITIFLDDLEKEVNEWGYEFKLNQKSQKFKLYVKK